MSFGSVSGVFSTLDIDKSYAYFLCLNWSCTLCLLFGWLLFFQLPLTKRSTEIVLSDLEARFLVDRAQLSEVETERLNSDLRTIRYNAHAVGLVYANVWRAGGLGFCGLGIANMLVAVAVYRGLKRRTLDDAKELAERIVTRSHSSSN